MNYKKFLLVFCLLVCVLFTISSVTAGDVNETQLANEIDQQIIEQVDDVGLTDQSDEVISSENEPSISQPDVASQSSDSNAKSSPKGEVLKASSSTKSSAKAVVSAPKVTNAYKSGTFKVTLKDAGTKKPVKGIALNIVVFTGKKYKVFTVKTNTKGVAAISTKSFSLGNHKVIVKAKNKKYGTISKVSNIKIVKAKKKVATKITAEYAFTSHNTYVSHGSNMPSIAVAYPYISICPTLKAANGKEIKCKYVAKVHYYHEGDSQPFKTETFEGIFGEYQYYSGTTGGRYYQVVISFKGTANYGTSTFKGSMVKF